MIRAAEAAKVKRKEAEDELRKHQQKEHLERLYDIGRIVYEIGMNRLDDHLIAGILTRGGEAIKEDERRADNFRAKGKSALKIARTQINIEVLLPNRPSHSIAGILREAGLRKDTKFTPFDRYVSRYSGKAKKDYLQRRLEGTGAVIKAMLS